jgi:CRP-like cAMP-binding protein
MRKALYILGLFSDEEIDWLAAAGRNETYQPGAVLIKEGNSPDSLFILLDGKLRVTTGKANKLVASLDSGDIVGELSYVDSRPASATVSAVERSLVLRVPREVVSAKLESDVRFAAHFYRAVAVFLAHRLRATVAGLGYTGGDQPNLSPDHEDPDEMAPELLDNLALGAARFEWLLNRMKR